MVPLMTVPVSIISLPAECTVMATANDDPPDEERNVVDVEHNPSSDFAHAEVYSSFVSC